TASRGRSTTCSARRTPASRRRSTCWRTAPHRSSCPGSSTTRTRPTRRSAASRRPGCTSCGRQTRSRPGPESPPRPPALADEARRRCEREGWRRQVDREPRPGSRARGPWSLGWPVGCGHLRPVCREHRRVDVVVRDPLEVDGVKVMSVGFLLAEAQMFAMPAVLASFVGHQLVKGVRWGQIGYLIIDLPPGTADLQQQLFATIGLAGAIIVVGPQDAAHLDARKLLLLLRDAAVPVLGAVENMRGLRCPHCGETVDVFPPVADERSLLLEIELLVSIPLDPAFAKVNGIPPQFTQLAAQIEQRLA